MCAKVGMHRGTPRDAQHAEGYGGLVTDSFNTPSRLALHACCGPCLIEPFDVLDAEFDQTVVIYFNPNIHPADEYERRRDTLENYAREAGIDVVELDYDVNRWMEQVAPLARDAGARCRACYGLRLGEVAAWAAANGFDAISTTLTVSPYQDADAIADEGRAAAARAGVHFVARDFRERYAEATRRSRDLGMYRQNYCGCVLSDIEAREQRAKRRAERARDKASADD